MEAGNEQAILIIGRYFEEYRVQRFVGRIASAKIIRIKSFRNNRIFFVIR